MSRPRLLAVTLVLALVVVCAPAPIQARQATAGATPVAIGIARALVASTIEPLAIVGGEPAAPTGVWSVGWYRDTGRLGRPGNLVLTGPLYGGDGWPAALYFLDEVRLGDAVEVTGDDGRVYPYAVASVDTYDATTAPVADIFAAEASGQRLTLFEGTGDYDYVHDLWLQVLVIRATRTADPPRPAPKPSPAVIDRPAGCPIAPAAALVDPGRRTDAELTGLLAIRDTLGEATAARATDVASINAQIAAATPCRVAVRAARRLPDGRTLALVGPAGDIPLATLTGAGADQPTSPAAFICAFLVFSWDGARWHVDWLFA